MQINDKTASNFLDKIGEKISKFNFHITSRAKKKEIPLQIYPDNKIEESITLYPNPAVDIVYIKLDVPYARVSIFNLNGAVLSKKLYQPKANVISMDVSNLHEGVYLVQIESIKGVSHSKIIKHR